MSQKLARRQFLEAAGAFGGFTLLNPLNTFGVGLFHERNLYAEKNAGLMGIVSGFQKEPLEALQAEYTSLFISGYPHTPCPPQESAFLEDRMLGHVNDVLPEIYAGWGFLVDFLMADHISTELEFLAFLLTASKVEGLTRTTSQGVDLFLENYIHRCVPQFAKDLGLHAKLVVYKTLADFLRKCVDCRGNRILAKKYKFTKPKP